MFGVYFFAGSWVIHRAALCRGAGDARVRAAEHDHQQEHLQDIGVLFAFTAFWAYIAFSRFFLMWCGNMPEGRSSSRCGWMAPGSRLASPPVRTFLRVLLPDGTGVKRNGATLALGECGSPDALRGSVLAGHADPPSGGLSPSLLDVAALMAVRRTFVATAGWLMRRQALVPVRDPRLAESSPSRTSGGRGVALR
jgi:hypothetical protein